MSSEFDRIALLTAAFGQPHAPSLGIGDDCAVLVGDGPVVVTVDASVEGRHFRRDLVTLDVASERAVEAALSDVAAMGAEVHVPGAGILLAWTLPTDLTDDDFARLVTGAHRAAQRVGTVVVGGNLSAGAGITLTTTVLARARGGRVLRRAGAVPGDMVVVSGVVGAAALGLRALLAGRGHDAVAQPFMHRWRTPRARIEEGHAALGWAHAMIDISDGLAQDVSHLAAASGCGVLLDAACLPMLPGQRSLAQDLGFDATELALTGGEDYELVATAPRGSLMAGWTIVGEVHEGQGVRVRDHDTLRALGAGWDHFTRRG